MAPLGVLFHLLTEDQGPVLSAILVPFDSNRFRLCPRAMSFFQKLCPAPFPPVIQVQRGDRGAGLSLFISLGHHNQVPRLGSLDSRNLSSHNSEAGSLRWKCGQGHCSHGLSPPHIDTWLSLCVHPVNIIRCQTG